MSGRAVARRAEAALAGAAVVLLRALGPVGGSNLGGLVARTVGPWLPVSRVAHANLRRAIPDLDEPARRRVVRGVWDNLGRTAAELPLLGRLHRTRSGPGWTLEGEEYLRALAGGGPAVFVSAHFGNWEILLRAAAEAGVVCASFYRAAANRQVDALIQRLRHEAMGTAAPSFNKGASGARGAVAHLRAGGVLAMLGDQKLNDGIEARLFGLPAMTAPAMAAFALRFRCPLIPARAERLGPARFRIIVEPPMPLPDSGDRGADIATLTQALNDRIEAWVRARPEQWLWLHRRWPPGV